MSLKYSSTTADYLIWSDAMNLIRKLAKDENYKISLLISLGCFTGLRISDILSLRWKQILGTDEFTVIEKKTGKVRTIRLNPQLQQHIKECYEHINPVGINAPILISQKGTIFTVQRINIILKEVKKKYRLKKTRQLYCVFRHMIDANYFNNCLQLGISTMKICIRWRFLCL